MTDLDAAARLALSAWGGGTLRPVAIRENAIYEAVLPGGDRAALRLHRPGYQSEASIRSELAWCAALAEAGFPCPRPLPTRGGDLLAHAGERRASLVTWLPGHPIGAAGTPLAGDREQHADLFQALGRLVARLHQATDTLTLPIGFTRPRWDTDGLLGDSPLWGRFWTNPALSGTESAFLLATRDEARAALEIHAPDADYGLIHADVLRENVLSDGATLHLIDFDDGGFGFRLYDLGTVLSQSLEEPHLPSLAAALTEGYATLRPLPPDAARLVTLFTMLRTFASCGWVADRMPEADPRRRFYADRALALARRWRDGETLA